MMEWRGNSKNISLPNPAKATRKTHENQIAAAIIVLRRGMVEVIDFCAFLLYKYPNSQIKPISQGS
jgi:hypothetical protein